MSNTEQLVTETLNSLDGVKRAAANPFLFTRIQERMKKSYEASSYPRKLMPALSVALVLFISLNVLSYYKVNLGTTPPSSGNTESGIENFANEYNLSEEGGL